MAGDPVGLRSAENEVLGETTLSVLAGVDEVGVVEGQLDSTAVDGIDSLNTEHEGVVLVTNLVSPAAEAATGEDVHGLELGEDLLEDALTLESGGGVTVVESTVVGGDDLVLGLDHLGVDKTLDAVLEEVLNIDRLHGRLRNLEHDGPVRTLLSLGRSSLLTVGKVESRKLGVLLRLVVGGVVGEDGGTVEGAVVLREVQPALVTDALRALTSDTDTNDVSGRVVELLGEGHELLVTELLGEVVNSHGVDKLVVADGATVGEVGNLLLAVNLGNLTLLAESLLLLGDGLGDSDPDTTGTITGGESEGSVGAPVTGNLVEDNVLGNKLSVRSGDTLTEPLALHLQLVSTPPSPSSPWGMIAYLLGGNGPDLVVVRSHEDVGNSLTHHAHNPLVKVLGLGVGNTALESRVNDTLDAVDLVLLGEHGDVVLEGVRNPEALVANVGDSLVGVPVIILGESLVDAVVEVLVVGEDNVATDIVELEKIQVSTKFSNKIYQQQLTKPSGVVSVLARPPALSEESTISHEGPFCIHRQLRFLPLVRGGGEGIQCG